MLYICMYGIVTAHFCLFSFDGFQRTEICVGCRRRFEIPTSRSCDNTVISQGVKRSVMRKLLSAKSEQKGRSRWLKPTLTQSAAFLMPSAACSQVKEDSRYNWPATTAATLGWSWSRLTWQITLPNSSGVKWNNTGRHSRSSNFVQIMS